ncbi:hypothetical protein HELRODRAFT_75968 [Helobdella robusta]|uniref:FERM domain-containing protein n=1 Tax=Helobdella robusta TaxID=6412 RepID=T1G2D3_HELRO|nr:hypothetical protein HELRODRAFT_75968 [Helobdella robusta]ESO07472.1 hypothetical protein HELRODRAFT_75968 [Helobdella robusta]
MKLVEQLPAYGQHFFKVRDKCGLPWLLAVGGKGLHVYDYNDLKVPRKEFLWKQINDLHHKEKKFVMTVG